MSCQIQLDTKDKLNIIVFLPKPWESYVRWPHIVAMSRYANVLAVEPPITTTDLFLRPQRILELFEGKHRLRKVSDSLTFYTPFAFVSYGAAAVLSFCKSINSAMIGWFLRRALSRLGIQDYIVFVFKAQQDFLVHLLDAKMVCYEVTDDYAEHPGLPAFLRRVIQKSEKRIAERVDIVFAVAQALYQRLRNQNLNTYYLRNAADVNHFSKALSSHIQVPEELEAIPEPRVGLVGHITEIVDMELLHYLASIRPQWSLVLIGPVIIQRPMLTSSVFQTLQHLPNVFFLGWKDYNTLPAYLKGLDVCLLPYVENIYTKSIHPQKMYQYLAAGKPVVSTNFPEARSLNGVMRIASNHESFIQAVEEALLTDSLEKREERMRIAAENSVDARARERMTIISHCLAEASRE